MSAKIGVLFLNLGGPDSMQAVEPFLMNLFTDPEIIRLPFSFLLQKPIARAIVKSRLAFVQEAYRHMGGRSPILPLTEAQARALEERLRQDEDEPGLPSPMKVSPSRGEGGDFTEERLQQDDLHIGNNIKVYIAMRYWHPYTEEALDAMEADGITQVVVLPLYPQFSLASTGSSLNALNRSLALRQSSLKLALIHDYHQDAGYIETLADLIRKALETNCWSCPQDDVQIVFSAHSLPEDFVKKTGDVYPDQIMGTIRAVMEGYFPKHRWELAYQSKVGRKKWLGPSTDGILHYFAGLNMDNLLLIPISFVSDHLETLVEIDRDYLQLARELGIQHCHRSEAPNTHPRFIDTLAHLVRREIKKLNPHAV